MHDRGICQPIINHARTENITVQRAAWQRNNLIFLKAGNQLQNLDETSPPNSLWLNETRYVYQFIIKQVTTFAAAAQVGYVTTEAIIISRPGGSMRFTGHQKKNDADTYNFRNL